MIARWLVFVKRFGFGVVIATSLVLKLCSLKQMRRLMGAPSIDLVCLTSLGAPHSGHFI
jgi:hypothetical protein